MLQHYDELAQLLEKEVVTLEQVAGFYQTLAENLDSGHLPGESELFAGGARSCDGLNQIAEEKRQLLAEIGVTSLHQLLAAERPAKIRRLVGLRGSEVMALRRKIEDSGKTITHLLQVLQIVNNRFCDFFQQLCPSAISYKNRGGMSDNGMLYTGITLNGVA